MFRKSPLGAAIAVALITPGYALAYVEVNGFIKNETSVYVQDGQRTGQASSQIDTAESDRGDLLKVENTAKFFFNGDIGEESTWHAEANLIHDMKGINDDYRGPKSYTQHDWLRELYMDTSVSDWDLRLGKQQVVWGTADGIKLLDIINPTDFREFNQNTFENSRIPIWMINAERNIGDAGNIQFIVSQAEENKIPGIENGGTTTGHPFMMKGADTITGAVNGFVNIAPALGRVSNSFHNFATAGSFTAGAPNAAALTPFSSLSVDGFAAQNWTTTFAGPLPLLAGTATPCASNTASASNPLAGGPGVYCGNPLLNTFANDTASVGANSNAYTTNLTNVGVSNGAASTVTWAPSAPEAAFEYMPNATFATFNTFAGNIGTGGTIPSMTTSYVKDHPDNGANAGFRWRSSTEGGLNYSLNYFYHYDANPAVDISYHDATTGERLITELRAPGGGGLPTGAIVSRNSATLNAFSGTTVVLRDSLGNYYGAVNPMTGATGDATHAGNGVDMRFTERLQRIHSIGGSFDMAIDSASLPLVIRGEVLYDRDTQQPVIDKRLMGVGDLEGALVMKDTDMFKYVIGADVTVLTNLLVSAQFIQFRNLDYVNDNRTCTTQFGSSVDCSRYTADFSTLHLDNELNRGWKNKEFYSLFLSKPFGPNQLGRVNNIVIYEEGGGWWDRIDAEYSLSDSLIVSGELNLYWGDEDTTFGQFEKSSNVQVGLKWLLE